MPETTYYHVDHNIEVAAMPIALALAPIQQRHTGEGVKLGFSRMDFFERAHFFRPSAYLGHHTQGRLETYIPPFLATHLQHVEVFPPARNEAGYAVSEDFQHQFTMLVRRLTEREDTLPEGITPLELPENIEVRVRAQMRGLIRSLDPGAFIQMFGEEALRRTDPQFTREQIARLAPIHLEPSNPERDLLDHVTVQAFYMNDHVQHLINTTLQHDPGVATLRALHTDGADQETQQLLINSFEFQQRFPNAARTNHILISDDEEHRGQAELIINRYDQEAGSFVLSGDQFLHSCAWVANFLKLERRDLPEHHPMRATLDREIAGLEAALPAMGRPIPEFGVYPTEEVRAFCNRALEPPERIVLGR